MKKAKGKKSVWFVIIGVVFMISGFSFISRSIPEAIVAVAIGVTLIYVWYPNGTAIKNSKEKSENINQTQIKLDHVNSAGLKQEWYDVGRLWEIVNESLSIIMTTANPDTFFSRYNLIFEMLEKIIAQDGKNNLLAAQELEKLKQSKSKYVDIFIDKMWNDMLKKMQELKTERGKLNRVNKFKDELKKYEREMTAENIQRYMSKQI